MDKATLLKSLRSLHQNMHSGHNKQVLGVIISRVNKAKRSVNDELMTRKQLIHSARDFLRMYESGNRSEKLFEHGYTVVQELLRDEEDFVVERDTKKYLENIVRGQLHNIVKLHPDYFTQKGLKGVFVTSLTKRLIGDILAYMEKVASRSFADEH